MTYTSEKYYIGRVLLALIPMLLIIAITWLLDLPGKLYDFLIVRAARLHNWTARPGYKRFDV